MMWLKEGDPCTRFFHLKANSRRRKKFIPCLRNNSGEYVWNHDGKEKILYDHFSSILGTAEQRLSSFQWDELELPQLPVNQLDAPFSEDEVRKAIVELPTEKAPTALPESSTDHAGKSSKMR
jgi:hypothetical protein